MKGNDKMPEYMKRTIGEVEESASPTNFLKYYYEYCDDENVYTPCQEVYKEYKEWFIENNFIFFCDPVKWQIFYKYVFEIFPGVRNEMRNANGRRITCFVGLRKKENDE